jgi:hypothetical protein
VLNIAFGVNVILLGVRATAAVLSQSLSLAVAALDALIDVVRHVSCHAIKYTGGERYHGLFVSTDIECEGCD